METHTERNNKRVNLQDQTTGGHTLGRHVALPVSGRSHVSDRVSELMVTDHHVHRISDTHTYTPVNTTYSIQQKENATEMRIHHF